MSIQNNIRNLLTGHSIIPVVTFHESDDPIALMNFFIQQDIHCIEVTLRTPYGMKAIELLKKEMDSTVAVIESVMREAVSNVTSN